jgi:hypothetical protein
MPIYPQPAMAHFPLEIRKVMSLASEGHPKTVAEMVLIHTTEFRGTAERLRQQ